MERPKEIIAQYLEELDKHLADLKRGDANSTFEIQDIARIMHIHPTHLSNTIKDQLGQSPCDIYEEKLMVIARDLIRTTDLSISEIARQFTYDPSNFTKFFKHFEGMTPKQFRERSAAKN